MEIFKTVKPDPENSEIQLRSIANFSLKKKKMKLLKYANGQIILVTVNNEIYVYGHNYYGQLGTGDKEDRNEFIKIHFLCNNILFLECSIYFTIIINENYNFYLSGKFMGNIFNKFTEIDNLNNFEDIKFCRCGHNFIFIVTNKSIYGIGSNTHRQLGCKDNLVLNSFTKIKDIQIKDLQCGEFHSIILDKYNDIHVTGFNYNGQLGTGNTETLKEFTKINLPFKIKKISCGKFYTIILNENNELYGTGYNGYGELGLKDTVHRSIFTKINLNYDNYIKNISIFNYFGLSTAIVINNKHIFVTGSEDEHFGMNKNLFRSFLDDFEDEYYFLQEFKELNYFKPTRNYIYTLCLDYKFFIIESDYKMEEEIEDNALGIKCLGKVFKRQLNDIQFVVL